MAYKDEYEVARLYTDPAFLRRLNEQFEGDFKLQFHLAPPLLSRRDPATGQIKKRDFGPWMLRAFKVLARLRGLRGGAFDIFGYQAERRAERQLITDYEDLVKDLSTKLDSDNHGIAVELASVPDLVRGYGHVKTAAIEKAKAKQTELLVAFAQPAKRAAAE